jgi:hypothetical protein
VIHTARVKLDRGGNVKHGDWRSSLFLNTKRGKKKKKDLG